LSLYSVSTFLAPFDAFIETPFISNQHASYHLSHTETLCHHPNQSNHLPMAVKKLLGSGWGGKLQKHEAASWKLDYCSPVYTPAETRDTNDDDTNDKHKSVESEGSIITVIDQL
jgi:hypothetical protein